jgi:hypothetical protein
VIYSFGGHKMKAVNVVVDVVIATWHSYDDVTFDDDDGW